MHDLSVKTILVTGSSKGIGAAIVRRLGEAGAHVILHYGSDRAGAERAGKAIEAERKCLLQADLAQRGQAEALWDAAQQWRGGIDVLVNNAAVMLWGGGFEEPLDAWDAVWDRTLEINVAAPARLLRRAVRHFLKRGGGTIVTLSSWTAQQGTALPDTIAYGASKAAIHCATQTIARSFAADGILAYILAPGVVDTRMSHQSAARRGGVEKVSRGLAMEEWVPPEDVAELVALLASGRLRHLSGATLDINGASYIR